jgi:flagellar basal-body rod modification protein FlgD
MVSSVAATTDTTAAAAAMKKSLGMNKDDFMKLFIAQLKYQDPLKPQDPSAMLDQLSQLTLVEQSYNSNTALNNLLTAQNNASNLSSVSFIGKEVKAAGNAISFDGTASANLQFNQIVPTVSNEISIKNAAGSVVRTITTGALISGDAAVSWDGRDNSGTLLPAGAYNFSVNGTTASASAVVATTFTSGTISGISFSNGSPMLTIGSITIPFSDVVSVKGV